MHATVRRYEGIDRVRSEEITRKVVDSLVRELSELPGFVGYFVIDASAQADASTRLAAGWIHEYGLGSALPNAPRITTGPVIALAPQLERRA